MKNFKLLLMFLMSSGFMLQATDKQILLATIIGAQASLKAQENLAYIRDKKEQESLCRFCSQYLQAYQKAIAACDNIDSQQSKLLVASKFNLEQIALCTKIATLQ